MGKKTFNAAGWFLLQLLLAALLSGCTFEHKIEAARKEWKEKKKAEASTPPQAEAVPNEMVYIPGGSFQMGDTRGGGYGVELPAHTVTLGGFYMGKYQVTQAQYLEVMGSNPSYFSNSPAAGEAQWNRPVETVSWYDAIVFCNKLSVAEGLNPAYSRMAFFFCIVYHLRAIHTVLQEIIEDTGLTLGAVEKL